MKRRKWKYKWRTSFLLPLLLAAAVFAGCLPLMPLNAYASKKEGGIGQARAEETLDSRFQHPGLLHTQAGFAKMKQNIDCNISPNKETWDALLQDGFSSADWNPRPLEAVIRGGSDNINQLRIDINRAYQNALIWKISGDEAHGQAACRIINAWTSVMKSLSGNADRFLAAGLQGYQLANVGEMMRDHPDFDTKGLQNLLLDIFYPMNEDFMVRHNDAYIGNYWANWELATIASMISIGVYCDREDIYARALDYFKTGKGNGSFYHAMPYVFDGVLEDEAGFAQWQESVRDQGHTTLGLMLCGVIMETAWNQGDNLYDLSDHRFMKAVEYVASFNSLNRDDLPSSWYEYRKGQKPSIVWYAGNTDYLRGSWRPIYYQMQNHYVNRKGLKMPNLEKAMSGKDYREGAPGRSSYDELGWYGVSYANLDTRAADIPIEGILSDGIYRIQNVSSGKSLVVNEEGNLAQAAEGIKQEEWWKVKNKGDGEYTLTNMVTGRLMQVNDEGNGIRKIDGTDYSYSAYYLNGTQIGTGEADGTLRQSFAFLAESDGSFRIVPSLNYYVLALENNSHEDNAKIIQWWNDASGEYWNASNPAQRWMAEKAKEEEPEEPGNTEEPGNAEEPSILSTVKTVKAVQQAYGKYVAIRFRKVSGAVSYDIYRSTKASGGYAKIGNTKNDSYEDRKALPSKTYYYKVRARAETAAGDGILSSAYAKIKTLASPAVKAKAASGRKIAVSWKTVRGAQGYVLYCSTQKAQGFKALKAKDKAIANRIVTAGKKAETVYLKVRPYYMEKGRKVYGPYSKTVRVDVKK